MLALFWRTHHRSWVVNWLNEEKFPLSSLSFSWPWAVKFSRDHSHVWIWVSARQNNIIAWKVEFAVLFCLFYGLSVGVLRKQSETPRERKEEIKWKENIEELFSIPADFTHSLIVDSAQLRIVMQLSRIHIHHCRGSTEFREISNCNKH